MTKLQVWPLINSKNWSYLSKFVLSERKKPRKTKLFSFLQTLADQLAGLFEKHNKKQKQILFKLQTLAILKRGMGQIVRRCHFWQYGNCRVCNSTVQRNRLKLKAGRSILRLFPFAGMRFC